MHMVYEIEEHKHRYAAWAASRASSVKGCRFTVQQGKLIIENTRLKALIDLPDDLPERDQVDVVHAEWRGAVIKESLKMGLMFSHGVAAKLINVYLKTIFVCGGHAEHEKVGCIHPPIDEILLKTLCVNDIGGLKKEWKKATSKRWSKFDSAQYEGVIENIRHVLEGKPMWKIEEYWQGYKAS